jgi:phosphoribosylformylglycinamidine synthase
MKPKAAILFTSGTNCDQETMFAFEKAGGTSQLVHTSQLKGGEARLQDFQVIIIPGGFSYGDHLGSATVWANELKSFLWAGLLRFSQKGGLILGICNGFQVLVRLGLLPNLEGFGKEEVALAVNESGRFECRWVNLRVEPQSSCVFTKNIDRFYLPVAHGEGNFVPGNEKVAEALEQRNLICVRYCDEKGEPTQKYPLNPNGSYKAIAGICDRTGRIFGLMPHPERHILPQHHPNFFLGETAGSGFYLFKNAINYFK